MELKNYGYVMQICQNLLKLEPDLLDARKLARHSAKEMGLAVGEWR